MASSKDFLNFILQQLSGVDAVSSRQMMGEYIIYYNGKVIGGIYDNCFMVKPVKSVTSMINGEMAVPYVGAREMFYIKDVENPELLCRVVKLVYQELYA